MNRETRKADFFDKGNVYNCDKTWEYYCSLDWKGPGWYRVVAPAGTMLAESEEGIDEFHCGTQGAGWLKKGAHSGIATGETRDATVCIDRSCWSTNPIKIKNCGDYFVYNLPQLIFCDSGYCTM